MGVDTQAQNSELDEEGEVDLKLNSLVILKNLKNAGERTKSQTMSLVSWKLNF